MCSSMRACMFVFVFACLFAHVLCYLTKKHEAKEAMRLCSDCATRRRQLFLFQQQPGGQNAMCRHPISPLPSLVHATSKSVFTKAKVVLFDLKVESSLDVPKKQLCADVMGCQKRTGGKRPVFKKITCCTSRGRWQACTGSACCRSSRRSSGWAHRTQ